MNIEVNGDGLKMNHPDVAEISTVGIVGAGLMGHGIA